MSKSRIQAGDIFKHNKDGDFCTIISAGESGKLVAQFDSGLRFTCESDTWLKEYCTFEEHTQITAEKRQQLEVKHIQRELSRLKDYIKNYTDKIEELEQKLIVEGGKLDFYEDICTDCLAGSMILPECSKCAHYKEAINAI